MLTCRVMHYAGCCDDPTLPERAAHILRCVEDPTTPECQSCEPGQQHLGQAILGQRC